MQHKDYAADRTSDRDKGKYKKNKEDTGRLTKNNISTEEKRGRLPGI